ncbi:hypothetical protein [Paenibacillus tarimensis]|uniref:hypothetical protein n=1 Tax=Paenibacillus tarimensis TaxID=416012 RepID=UPI001F3815F7|nr:hypothetical protein [Paenibacillus tarimensis]MCF2946052.1 hypothetical protein [Paenibacillus tarimensis]
MRKLLVVMSGVLVLSNAIWGYLYWSRTVSEQTIPIAEDELSLYTMSGSGHLWEITGHKILISSDKIMRGRGKLTYKGEPYDLENSRYIEITFRESTPDGRMETVSSNEYRSLDGPVSILANVEQLGSMTSPYSSGEFNKTKMDYENTVMEVTWEDDRGQMQTEIVELDIEGEIIL